MLRRLASAAIALAIVACAVSASAQETAVAVYLNPEIRPYHAVLEGFKSSCDCTVTELPLAGKDHAPPVETLAAGKLKLVLAVGLEAGTAAAGVRDLPVLLTMVPDVRARIAGHPNWSGIEMALPPARHLEAMRRLFPEAKRIGVIYNPATLGEYVREAGVAARGAGLTLVTREIREPREALARLEELKGQVDAFWMLPEPALAQPEVFSALLLFSYQNRVPVYSFAKKYVALGAIAALTIEPRDLGVLAGEFARGILQPGANATTARWKYARESDLVVNRKIAEKMGLQLGADALRGATDVSE
jgi:putative ABC transport system substrate-binding protein